MPAALRPFCDWKCSRHATDTLQLAVLLCFRLLLILLLCSFWRRQVASYRRMQALRFFPALRELEIMQQGANPPLLPRCSLSRWLVGPRRLTWG